MEYLIYIALALCAALALLAWRRAERAWRAVRALRRRERETPQPAADALESDRRAREAIARFNQGIASILNFDAGGRGGEGL